MEIGNVHHLGYLIKDIKKSILAFKTLGYEIEDTIFFDKERLSHFCFLKKAGIRVELVEPNEESDIYPLLKKYKNSIYHVCYVVDNIDDSVEKLKKEGFLLFKGKQNAPAISKTALVVFMMHTCLGMIELVQER